MATKHEVLRANLPQWLASKGKKKERGLITKRLAVTLSIHPKSVGRAMRRVQLQGTHKPEKRGRAVVYGTDVTDALVCIWEAMNMPCAENMYPAISVYIPFLKKQERWSTTLVKQLDTVSVGTLKNRIAIFRAKRGTTRGKSATVSSPLKGMIPIRKSHTWQGLAPGFLQTDTVVHCGDLLTGDVLYSVGCVDYATYWHEYTAQWNKGQEVTRDSLEVLCDRFPMPIQELHPDTGNEFINYHLQQWATEKGYALTRSEPYKKNDNMCIEERNNSIARKYLEYARLDDVAMVPCARDILEVVCTLHNHFIPVRRMTSKVREGARWKRTFEKVAKTPYQRVLEHSTVSEEVREKLRTKHATLNPLLLKQELDTLRKKLETLLVLKKKAGGGGIC